MNTIALNNYFVRVNENKTPVTYELVKQYEDHIDASTGTKKTYSHCVNKFLSWLVDNQIEEVTQDVIIDYKNELRGTMQANALNTHLTAIKDLFKYLETKGFKNVSKNVKKERTTNDFKKDSLTSEQVRVILKNIDLTTIEGLRANALFRLLIGTGLRECEVIRADIRDIRTKGNANVLYIQGKGHNEKDNYVVLYPSVLNAIQEYLKERNAKDTEPLFTSLSDRNKGQRLTTRTIQRIVKGLYKDNGIINDKLTTHSTRHTAITLSILQGANIQDAQQMARHKSINTTMIYYHNLNRLENNAESKLESLFSNM